MKKIEISTSKISNLDPTPMVLVVGSNQQYKARLFNIILADEAFYSLKFGKILYIGERKYKSQKIVQQQDNWKENATYQELMDMLDDAKNQKIINLLIVINTKSIENYISIIERLLGLRMNYLPGIISLLVNVNDLTDIRKDLLASFNTVFCFQTDKMIELMSQFKIKKEIEQKRKKDVYVFGLNKVQIFKDIKD